MMIARRLIIHGRVQGVWYRSWAIREARGLGLAGWVRNRRDGTVEAWAEGEAEAVAAFETKCREGPSKAEVERVERHEEKSSGLGSFDKRATT